MDEVSPLSRAINDKGGAFNPFLWTGAGDGGLFLAAEDAIALSECAPKPPARKDGKVCCRQIGFEEKLFSKCEGVRKLVDMTFCAPAPVPVAYRSLESHTALGVIGTAALHAGRSTGFAPRGHLYGVIADFLFY